jgi:DNA mismatch repair ATPase MutL
MRQFCICCTAVFRNGRLVEHDRLIRRLDDVYTNLSAALHFAFVILTMPQENIDVNVHPKKTVVRFLDEANIVNELCVRIQAAIEDRNLASSNAHLAKGKRFVPAGASARQRTIPSFALTPDTETSVRAESEPTPAQRTDIPLPHFLGSPSSVPVEPSHQSLPMLHERSRYRPQVSLQIQAPPIPFDINFEPLSEIPSVVKQKVPVHSEKVPEITEKVPLVKKKFRSPQKKSFPWQKKFPPPQKKSFPRWGKVHILHG